MPELPEVETIRRYLVETVVHRTILEVPHLDPRMVKLGEKSSEEIILALTGKTILGVDRRGKYLRLRSDPGQGLLLHLGMSGRLTREIPQAPWRPHTHLVLRFSDFELRLSDPRRFGRVGWSVRWSGLAPRMGIEPLSPSFSPKWLEARLNGRKSAIKSILLSQTVVAGIGNIYADEALHRSGIHPAVPAGSLDSVEVERLVQALKKVLRSSLRHRGTSFSDYVDALGHPGENQGYLKVYGRRSRPCTRCAAPIQTVVIQGRTSHFCPVCQPLPR